MPGMTSMTACYATAPKNIRTVGQNFGPNFYKRHVSEKVRSSFGGKTKRWRQEMSKLDIKTNKNFVWRKFTGKIFLNNEKKLLSLGTGKSTKYGWS